MMLGNNRDFHEAWRDLRESFVRKIAQIYYGISLNEMDIRTYRVDEKDLSKSLDEIRWNNKIKSVMFRTQRKIWTKLKQLFV